MANYVKVATLACAPPPASRDVGQAAVDEMIEFWDRKLQQVLPDEPDLIALPECCDLFTTHSPKQRRAYYQIRGNQVRDFFASIAQQHRCHIAYAAIRQMSDGTWRNAMQMLNREGKVIGGYHKRHVVIGETTEDGILCGADASVIGCDFGRVGCAICFDLNFDLIRRRYVDLKPDLILFPSMYHGGLMQNYWAYACRAYFVASLWNAPSQILSPVGHPIATTTNYLDHVTATINLDNRLAHFDGNQKAFAAMKAKYGRGVRIFDPGYLGVVMITSEADDVTAGDLVAEFGIELVDDYMARALAHHLSPENVEPSTPQS